MKVYLDRDEVWPVYSLFTASYTDIDMVPVELSEPEYADYKAVCSAYEEWQGKLMQMWKQKENW